MASFVGLHTQTFLGHLNLTGVTNEVTFGPLTRAMQDSTTFADGGYTCVLPGLISGEANLKGFQDYAVDALDDEVSVAQLGTQFPLTVVPNPTGTVTAGDTAYLSRALVASNSQTLTKGELAGFELGFGYDTAIPRGVIAHPAAARTTTGNGTAIALTGPTATQSLYAALHVTAYSGLTNIIVKVQSDDNSGFTTATDRITFSTVTGTTSQWSSVAGNLSTETHWRAQWTVSGTGSCTFAVAFGVI